MEQLEGLTLAYIAFGLIWLAVILRALLRPHREPTSRLAWILLIIGVPVVGILAYILLGETNIGRRRVARARKVLSEMPVMAEPSSGHETRLEPEFSERSDCC
jgi:cardiolipin synthase